MRESKYKLLNAWIGYVFKMSLEYIWKETVALFKRGANNLTQYHITACNG